jgi:hypothetical protein
MSLHLRMSLKNVDHLYEFTLGSLISQCATSNSVRVESLPHIRLYNSLKKACTDQLKYAIE